MLSIGSFSPRNREIYLTPPAVEGKALSAYSLRSPLATGMRSIFHIQGRVESPFHGFTSRSTWLDLSWWRTALITWVNRLSAASSAENRILTSTRTLWDLFPVSLRFRGVRTWASPLPLAGVASESPSLSSKIPLFASSSEAEYYISSATCSSSWPRWLRLGGLFSSGDAFAGAFPFLRGAGIMT